MSESKEDKTVPLTAETVLAAAKVASESFGAPREPMLPDTEEEDATKATEQFAKELMLPEKKAELFSKPNKALTEEDIASIPEEELEAKTEEILEVDEIEQSAKTVHLLFQHFRKVGYKLADRKKKAPIRVLEALLFDGLEDVELNGKEEENLLDIARQIMYHKSVLIDYALQKREEQENGEEDGAK